MSLRALKVLARDINGMVLGLPPHEREALEALLAQRLSVDADAERAAMCEQVAMAIRRGTSGSEKERRRIEDYAEALEALDADATEFEAVRRLLAGD